MKIPVAWLREYVPVPEDEAGLQDFSDLLTMAGLEVEEIHAGENGTGPIFDTKITPNRGDWASVYGTAREAAAAGSLPLAPYPGYPSRAPEPTAASLKNDFASVTVESTDLCPRFSITVVTGVKVGPSPQWMQDRLVGAGQRSVNNVVDITNYVMLETGQPLHAFDLDLLSQGQVIVREAREGEKITTLDEVERQLQPGMLCICDHEQPISIAGIKGGALAEITDTTTNLLLEAAHFDALSIRRTAKKLALNTDASYRFERYVDPLLVSTAAARAAALLVELAGGTIQGKPIDIVSKRFSPRRVVARVDRIRKLLGADVERDAMNAGLERLGISVERSAGAIDCVIPAWRPDVTREDDIAEEVGRISLGYANLPETLPPVRTGRGGDSLRGRFITQVRETLVRAGLQDVHTHSLRSPSPLDDEEAAHRVNIRVALTLELSTLRISLLPNLIDILARAHASGLRDAAIFEVGPVYRKNESAQHETTFHEPLRITAVLTGSAMPQAWAIKPDALAADFYFAKGVAEELLRAVGATGVEFVAGTQVNMHPGRTAHIVWDGATIGYVAEISELTAAEHKLPRRVYVFDFDGDALLARYTGTISGLYTPIPTYPSVTRDVAPVFDTSVSFEKIESVAVEAAGPLLEKFVLTDVYESANLGAGKRALTLRFTFRSAAETLKDAEVEAALSAIRAALVEHCGAELRA